MLQSVHWAFGCHCCGDGEFLMRNTNVDETMWVLLECYFLLWISLGEGFGSWVDVYVFVFEYREASHIDRIQLSVHSSVWLGISVRHVFVSLCVCVCVCMCVCCFVSKRSRIRIRRRRKRKWKLRYLRWMIIISYLSWMDENSRVVAEWKSFGFRLI